MVSKEGLGLHSLGSCESVCGCVPAAVGPVPQTCAEVPGVSSLCWYACCSLCRIAWHARHGTLKNGAAEAGFLVGGCACRYYVWYEGGVIVSSSFERLELFVVFRLVCFHVSNCVRQQRCQFAL